MSNVQVKVNGVPTPIFSVKDEILKGMEIDGDKFTATASGRNILRTVMKDVKNFWEGSIDRFFNRRRSMGLPTSGHLRNSCIVIISSPLKLAVKMSQLFHMHQFSEGNIFSRYEYGRFLREGTLPSPGVFIPEYDARGKRGINAGISPLPWTQWERTLSQATKRMLLGEIENNIKDVIRESKKLNPQPRKFWESTGAVADQYWKTKGYRPRRKK